MPRQMRDPAFRKAQHDQLHEPHIAPITAYVEQLRADSGRWLPYVAPLHGGINARLLTVLRDPGPKVHEVGGSGMLCVENDDQTAESKYSLMQQAGLAPSDFTPWNAYPWYINSAPTPAQIAEAAPTLVGLINLMPDLQAVLLHGIHAADAWRVALSSQSALRARRLEVFETYHPSNQALRTNVPGERERRKQHRIDTWIEAGDWLRAADSARQGAPAVRGPGHTVAHG
ncbi:MAG: hypothetical protein C0444_03160 [Microbacterium sp.]|nr:hypothetical protein [Microbacterium sp.]MBA4345629.1 hypothetical protein [Microbacterium sp.]